MKTICLILYRLNFWLMGRIVEPSDVEFVVKGCRYLHYEMRWSLEDGKIVGRLVAQETYGKGR